jgi:hypothetical protein
VLGDAILDVVVRAKEKILLIKELSKQNAEQQQQLQQKASHNLQRLDELERVCRSAFFFLMCLHSRHDSPNVIMLALLAHSDTRRS